MTDEAIRFYAWIRSVFPRRHLRIRTFHDAGGLVAQLVEHFPPLVTPAPLDRLYELDPDPLESQIHLPSNRYWRGRTLYLEAKLDLLHGGDDYAMAFLAEHARVEYASRLYDGKLHDLQIAQQVPR